MENKHKRLKLSHADCFTGLSRIQKHKVRVNDVLEVAEGARGTDMVEMGFKM